MILDFAIFGNGHGLKSPYFDDVFYWLVDTNAGREHGKGAFYTFSHGLGAQLRSCQWRIPAPGARRRLAGREFVAFSVIRRLFRVQVSWALCGMPSNLDDAHVAIRTLKADLDAGRER